MSQETHAILEFGAYRIDLEQRLLFSGSEVISLAPKTFETLVALIEGQGRIVEKETLLKRVWPDTFVEEGSLARNVSILRKTLGQGVDDQTYIETVPKRGYRFVAPVNVVEAARTSLPPSPAPSVHGTIPTRRRKAIIAVLTASAAVVAAIAWAHFDGTRPSAPSTVLRLGFMLPASEPFEVYAGAPSCAIALSRDGEFLVYDALSLATNRSHLYVRHLNQFDARVVQDSENAFNPFIAPDGGSIGFFADDVLKKVSVSGGPSETLARVGFDSYGGAEWEDDGTIVFDSGHGLARIASTGGTPQDVTLVDQARGEIHHLWPHVLPGGNELLFTVQSTSSRGVDVRVDALSLSTGERRTVLGNAAFARYLPSGRLIYSSKGSIFGVPFDAAKVAVTGTPVKLLDDVAASGDSAHLTVSRDGTLAYVRGEPVELKRTLVVVDRSGAPTALRAPPRGYQGPKVSPDSQNLLVFLWESGPSDVWMYNFVRESLSRLTSTGTAATAIWSSDGQSVVYQDMRDGPMNLLVQRLDGQTPPRKISPVSQQQYPHSFSHDGRSVIYTQADPGPRHGDVWTSFVEGSAQARRLLPQQTYEQWGGWPSRDGRWLAYVSDETGRFEVYVTDIPGLARRWQISTNGGQEPVWSKDGSELFYREGRRMMSVSLGASPGSPPGKAVVLFEGDYVACCAGLPQYDTMPGGRFLMIKDADASAFTELRLVTKWRGEPAR